MPTEYVEVVVDEIRQVTENAVLCEFEDVGAVWLPLSQIEDAPDFAIGDKDVVVSVAKWLAKKENLD